MADWTTPAMRAVQARVDLATRALPADAQREVFALVNEAYRTGRAEPVRHEMDCDGWHVSAVSCEEVTARRAHPDLSWCSYSNHGYHGFVNDPEPDQRCRFEGCERTWGELQAATPKEPADA